MSDQQKQDTTAVAVVSSGEKPKRGYWYKHYIRECPICGRGEHVRVRQYDTPPPPKNSPERWDYNGMAYDWCDV